MFEHRETVPTPLGGGMIAQSPIRPAHLAPCHDIRYSRRPAEAVWCVQFENASGGMCVWKPSVGRCLSIVLAILSDWAL